MSRTNDSEAVGCRAVNPEGASCGAADSNVLAVFNHPTAHEDALSLYANENTAGGLSVALPFASPVTIFKQVPVVGALNERCTADANFHIEIGCKLKLKCQRNNLLDKWAVEVLFQNERLGWVSADANEVAFRLLDGGKTLGASVVDEEYTPQGIRYLIDITLED